MPNVAAWPLEFTPHLLPITLLFLFYGSKESIANARIKKSSLQTRTSWGAIGHLVPEVILKDLGAVTILKLGL